MKKTIAILLVAIMAVGSVFATFSGEASIGFGGNLDNGNFGFIDTGAKVKVDFDLSTASVDTTPTETVAEDGTVTPAPSIYAAVKGSLGVRLFTGEENVDEIEDPNLLSSVKLGVTADITEATIGGQNWSVSILEVASAPNYAKGFQTYTVEDGYDKWGFERADFTENYNTELAFEKAPGITATVYGYKVGFGMLGDYASRDWKLKDNLNMSVMFETPAYDFGVEGLSLQAGTAYSYKTFKELNDDGVPVYGDKTNDYGDLITDKGDVVDKDNEKADSKTASEFSRTNQWNISAKAGYATDLFSVAIATDMGVTLGADPKFDADVALDATYDFLTVNAYYGTNPVTGKTPKKAIEYQADGMTPDKDEDGNYKLGANKNDAYWKERSENMLSAQVKVDLNSFEIPVAVTLGMNDILAKQAMTASVEVTPIDGLKLTVNGGYTINDDGRTGKDKAGVIKDYTMVIDKDAKKVGKWTAGMSGEYSFAYGKVTAGLSLEQKLDAKKNLIVGANAAFENSTLIPGATLKFAWADAKDMLGKDADKTDFGKITASVSMTF